MISKCVILAAGEGTRMRSVKGESSKEMLVLKDRKIVSFAIEEALESGFKEILVVISRKKRDLERYLQEEKRKGIPIEIIYNEPQGIIDSISSVNGFVNNEPFGMIFPDMLVVNSRPALLQLVDIFRKNRKPVIGLINVNPLFGDAWKMEGKEIEKNVFEVKRIKKESQSKIRFFPRYILPENTFLLLKNLSKLDSEVPLLEKLIETIGLQGVLLEGEPLDTGTPKGYEEAKKMVDS